MGYRYQVRVKWLDGAYVDTAAFPTRQEAREWVEAVEAGSMTLPSGMVRCPSGAVLLGPREGMDEFELLKVL